MDQVRIFALGGFDESGKSMYVVEANEAILIIEARLKYPESDQLGVEFIMPDPSYLIQNRDRIKGIFTTHAHDDVIATLPYLLKQINVPVYTGNLTANVIHDILKKEDIKNVKIHCMKRASKQTIGGVKVRTSLMTHAFPDNFGLAITTDQGYIVYTGEFIIDYDMLQQEYLCDLNELSDIGKRDVLCLPSESQSADRIGHTAPKHRITNLIELILKASHSRTLVSPYSQSLSHTIEITELAKKYNREIFFRDKGMCGLFHQLELVKYYHASGEMEVKEKDFKDDMEDVVVLITGNGKNLFRTISNIVNHEDKFVSFRETDIITVASSIVSGIEPDVNNMENETYKEGGRIFTLDSKTVLPVHPSSEDLKMMLYLFQSKYYTPVRDEYRHLFVSVNLANKMGYSPDRILTLENGQVAQFEEKTLKSAAKHPEPEDILIDDKESWDVTGVMSKDREVLSAGGVMIIGVGVSHKTKEVINGPDAQTHGLIYPEDADYIIKEVGNIMEECIEAAVKEKRYDNLTVRGEARERISKYLSKETGKRSMVLPVTLEINIQDDKRRGQETLMVKSETRKSQKQRQMIESEVPAYIHSLVLITLSIIGGSQIGFIGELTTSIIKYVFGNLYGVVYDVAIVLCVMMMSKKPIRDVPMKYLIGIGVLLCAWIIAASVPQNEMLKGMGILSCYPQDSMLIFRGEIAAKGGLIGAFLVSLCMFLLDYKGARVIVIALLILVLILLLSGSGPARLKAGITSLVAPFVSMRKNHAVKGDVRRECKQQVGKVKKEQEVEPKKAKSMFSKINIDECVRPGQASFLDVDDDFDIQSDGRSTAPLADEEHALEEESNVLNEQAFKGTESKRIVEDTVGGKDIFVSSFQEDRSKYKLPCLILLKDADKKSRSAANASVANDAGRQLIEILGQFGVKTTPVVTHIGPAVTKSEVKPDLGAWVNKISNLQYDIKMALAARDIRIEVPTPGKSTVGIEIPNVEKTSVSTKELMKNIPGKPAQNKMPFALGKDLMGNCVYGELNRIPHLLIAGATGSGKSVCVNSIIASTLTRARPGGVKLLLVDPKKAGFTPYKEISYLLGPMITDGGEANRASKVTVTMMDNRYELFSMAGVRNIAGYNVYIGVHPEEGLSPFPWVAVIIDELAGLMLVAAKEVEANIQRITQLARAAGIHLIVATQRLSVDVITGTIKVNTPSRIVFAVSSVADSRTILDQMGAEELLGYGNMLYVPVGGTVATRVQGVPVSDDEVSNICEPVSRQGKPKFDNAFVRLELLDGGVGPTSSETSDPLYDEVKEFIIPVCKASTSLIRRKFSVGYVRAARLIDTLEDNGIVGPVRGGKSREVYARSEQAEEE